MSAGPAGCPPGPSKVPRHRRCEFKNSLRTAQRALKSTQQSAQASRSLDPGCRRNAFDKEALRAPSLRCESTHACVPNSRGYSATLHARRPSASAGALPPAVHANYHSLRVWRANPGRLSIVILAPPLSITSYYLSTCTAFDRFKSVDPCTHSSLPLPLLQPAPPARPPHPALSW